MKKLILITAVILTANLMLAQIINIPADYATIQEGIDASNEGDTILVQPGTYVENIDLGWDGGVTLASMFLITGDTSYISQTIIDGNNNGSVISYIGINSNYTITGFTIQNGEADDYGSGGGICYYSLVPNLNQDSITFKNLIIRNNHAADWGGGMFISSYEYDSLSYVHIEDVKIYNNHADGDSHGDDYWGGGGIFCENISPLMYNVMLENNSTGNTFQFVDGTGACFINSDPLLENVKIIDSERGFNIKVELGAMALVFVNSNPILKNVLISGHFGEGIYLWNSDAIIQNVTIVDNDYGGLFCDSSNVIIQNVTIVDNGSVGLKSGSSNVVITNSVIYGHESSGPDDYQIKLYNSTATISYTDIEDGEDGIYIYNNNSTLNWLDGNINEDPLFVGVGEHPYQIDFGSPCIDAGTPDTIGLNLPEDDIIGNERIWDGDDNGTEIIDMGAYEFGSIPVGIVEPILNRIETYDILLYPNPAHNQIEISCNINKEADTEIGIYSLIGQKMLEYSHGAVLPGQFSQTINISKLPIGTYLLRMRVGDEVVTKKIVKL